MLLPQVATKFYPQLVPSHPSTYLDSYITPDGYLFDVYWGQPYWWNIQTLWLQSFSNETSQSILVLDTTGNYFTSFLRILEDPSSSYYELINKFYPLIQQYKARYESNNNL